MTRRLGAEQNRVPRSPRPEVLPSSPAAHENRLLGRLPPGVLSRLTPHLEPVHLRHKEVLFRAHEVLPAVYFPDTAVVSLISTLESGDSLEVGLVGRDGFVGTSIFPGIFTMSCDGIVQIPGTAQRIAVDVLRAELLTNEALHSTLCQFAHVLLVRSMQMSVCNMFHPVEQRCIRWLLNVNDVMGSDDILLTHDLMATMLGVHRPTVTLVLRSLHKAGLVSESRGHIVIRDRRRLEQSCCECYRSMRNEQHRLLGY